MNEIYTVKSPLIFNNKRRQIGNQIIPITRSADFHISQCSGILKDGSEITP